MIKIDTVHLPAGFGCEEFNIAIHPITIGQWNDVMGKEDKRKGIHTHPVTEVNVDDIYKFLSLLDKSTGKTYRLPTEIEWCRCLGVEPNEEDLEKYAVFGKSEPFPVCSRESNEFGLYDMRGLVWEWMTTGKKGNKYALRGGSWSSYRRFARAVARVFIALPADRYFNIGFRVVEDLRTREGA